MKRSAHDQRPPRARSWVRFPLHEGITAIARPILDGRMERFVHVRNPDQGDPNRQNRGSRGHQERFGGALSRSRIGYPGVVKVRVPVLEHERALARRAASRSSSALLLLTRRGPLDPVDPASALALALAGAGWAASTWAARRAPPRGGLGWVVGFAVALRLFVLCAPAPATSDDREPLRVGGRARARRPQPVRVGARRPGVAGVARAAPGHLREHEPPRCLRRLSTRDAGGLRGRLRARRARGANRSGRAVRARCALRHARRLRDVRPLRLVAAGGSPAPAAVGPEAAAVAWAWSPLVVLEFAGSAHFDSLGILLWMTGLALSVSAATSARRCSGLALQVAAVLVKFLPPLRLALRPPRAWCVARGRVRRRPRCAGLRSVAAARRRSLRPSAAACRSTRCGWESTSLVYRFIEPLFASLPQDGTWSDPRRLGRATIGAAWLALAACLWIRRSEPLRACVSPGGRLSGLESHAAPLVLDLDRSLLRAAAELRLDLAAGVGAVVVRSPRGLASRRGVGRAPVVVAAGDLALLRSLAPRLRAACGGPRLEGSVTSTTSYPPSGSPRSPSSRATPHGCSCTTSARTRASTATCATCPRSCAPGTWS